MLSEGKYKAVAVSTGLGEAGTGTAQIGVMFRITQGESAGSVVGWRGFFTDNTTQRTIESLRHAGWTGYDLSVFTETTEVECERLLPSEVEIVVEHKPPTTPEGRTFAEVRWVNKLGTGVVSMKNKLDMNKAKAFAERMKAACVAVPATSTHAPRTHKKPSVPNNQRSPAFDETEPPEGMFDDDFPL
jgi:hypothetical protein